MTAKKKGKARGKANPNLDDLIAKATVDCYNDSEAHTGFYETLRDELPFPFKAKVIGEEVDVHDLDLTQQGLVEAICFRGKKEYRVALLSLEIQKDLPHIEWLEAYRKFCRSL